MRSVQRYVLLDPDGTWKAGWIAVIVEHRSGVTYENQCTGHATEVRSAEGYLVPLDGLKRNTELGLVDSGELRAPFHADGGCAYGSVRGSLPPSRQEALTAAIQQIPYWHRESHQPDGEELRGCLQIDTRRVEEMSEAWVPVMTPDGPGILVWDNCD